MTRLAAILILCASTAAATNIREWGGKSSLVIDAPETPGAVATVTFINALVHNRDEAFTLTFEGMDIAVEFDWNADGTQSERVTVYPPDGYVAIPRQITVGEDQTQKLHIFKWEGV